MPRIVEQLTGETWRGRFEHGPATAEIGHSVIDCEIGGPDGTIIIEEDGCVEWDVPPGWIVVKIHDHPDIVECFASATVGNHSYSDDRGNIEINLEDNCGSNWLGLAFAHEIGHSFGFWHVCGVEPRHCPPGWVPGHIGTIPLDLVSDGTGTAPGIRIEYTPALKYHARLAYEIGPGLAYCDLPFAQGCAMVDPMARIRP